MARLAAIGGIAIAVVLVALLMFEGDGGGYQVKARFINAGQLVRGNLVLVGGAKAGTVESFRITEDGQAEVDLKIDEKYAPLRRGTRAVIRQGSQSSVASKYIDLHFPSENGKGDTIADGGVIGVDRTTTSVEFDQFLNIFDPETRRSVRGFFQGQAKQYAGVGGRANAGFRYLNASLSASDRLFRELTFDPPVLERFLVDTSRFVTDLSQRREDLAALIGNLNRTTRALGSEKEALAEAIGRFPNFMRQANTTYVNLRSTLDELDPFVEASKPVAKKLRPYLAELRPFAQDARPTVRDLALTIHRPGADNDLRELNNTYPPLAEIAVEERRRNGEIRRGAFPEGAEAFRKSAPIIAHGRPYTIDFVGWLDDFSHTGAYDALGSFSRSHNHFNAFTVELPPADCPAQVQIGGGCLLLDSPLLPPAVRDQIRGLRSDPELFGRLTRIEQFKRCPGAAEEPAPDNSNVFSQEEQDELDCRESHRATGNR